MCTCIYIYIYIRAPNQGLASSFAVGLLANKQ